MLGLVARHALHAGALVPKGTTALAPIGLLLYVLTGC